MNVIIIVFAIIGLATVVMIGIGLLFINPSDDRDCLCESDLWVKYHKGDK